MKSKLNSKILYAILIGSFVLGDILLYPEILLEIGVKEFIISAAILVTWCICIFILGMGTLDKKTWRTKIHTLGIAYVLILVIEVVSYCSNLGSVSMLISVIFNAPLPTCMFYLWSVFNPPVARAIEIACCGLLPYILLWISALSGSDFAIKRKRT